MPAVNRSVILPVNGCWSGAKDSEVEEVFSGDGIVGESRQIHPNRRVESHLEPVFVGWKNDSSNKRDRMRWWKLPNSMDVNLKVGNPCSGFKWFCGRLESIVGVTILIPAFRIRECKQSAGDDIEISYGSCGNIVQVGVGIREYVVAATNFVIVNSGVRRYAFAEHRMQRERAVATKYSRKARVDCAKRNADGASVVRDADVARGRVVGVVGISIDSRHVWGTSGFASRPGDESHASKAECRLRL